MMTLDTHVSHTSLSSAVLIAEAETEPSQLFDIVDP